MKYFKALILCLVVLTVTIVSGISANAFGTGTDGNIYYNRASTVYPVMNADTHHNMSFLLKYASSVNSVYNIAPDFYFLSGSGASSLPSRLYTDTSFRHKNDDKTYDVEYIYDFESALMKPAEKSDFYVSFSANLTNDRHWNIKRHLETFTAYPITSMSTPYGPLIAHSSRSTDNDATLSMGVGRFEKTYYTKQLIFRALGMRCTCGNSKVSNINIMLADTVGPRVNSIYVTRFDGTAMKPATDFKAGDEIYINLRFDENIRFANDSTMKLENAPKLKLKIARITDNVQEMGIAAEASLVSLDKDTLTFKYSVPESYSINGETIAVNHYIYEIEPYASQGTWINSDNSVKTYDLKLFGKNSSTLTTVKASSLIVDLAGNPINGGSSSLKSEVKLKSPAYMDSVAPVVSKIEIVRPYKKDSPYTGSDKQLNRSDVFAGTGEKIGFRVDFSEKLFDCSNSYSWVKETLDVVWIGLTAELNISESGVPVTAAAKSITTIIGRNGNPVSQIYFEMDQPISASMTPTVYNDVELPIGINRIYEDRVWNDVCDRSGNQYAQDTKFIDASEGQRIMPVRQLWLDTAGPTVSTPLSESIAGYAPIGYAGGDNPSEFYFPVIITDLEPYGDEYRSLTNGAFGSFMWRDNMANPVDFAYEYVVTGSAEKPADSEYRLGTTGKPNSFTQIDSGNYIHIRLLNGVRYNIGDSDIVIMPTDYAGNTGEVAFPIDYELDMTGPLITMDSFKKQYTGGEFGGSIITDIGVRDVSEISSIEYQWTALGADPEGEWIYAVTTGDAVTIILDNLEYSQTHRYSLHVRSSDVLDYTTSVRFDYEYDLERIAYNIEFLTDPERLFKKHSAELFLADGGPEISPEGVADRVMILIAKPGMPDHYWSRSFSYEELRGESNAADILDINQGNIHKWTKATKTYIVNPEETSSAAYIYSHMPLTQSEKTELIGGFYGKAEITVIARRPSEVYDTLEQTIIPSGENRTEDVYIFNYANGDAVSSNTKIHGVDVTAITKVASDAYSENPKVVSVVPSQPSPPITLDGAVFTVSSLRNELVYEYGMADIDFESESTYFALFKTGTGATGIPLFTSPLLPSASQDIVIPKGAAVASGAYKVVVSLKSKNSAHIDRWEYDEILIDRRELTVSGISQVRTIKTVDNGRMTLPEAVSEYFSEGFYEEKVYVSADPDSTHYLKFTAEFPELDFTTNTEYIKVWNATAANTGLGIYIPKSSHRWISFHAESGLEIKTMLLSEATKGILEDCLSGDDPNQAAYIPILQGDNVINYQVATTSGYVSPVQTLLIQVGTDIPTIEMNLSPYLTDGSATRDDVIASIQALGSRIDPPDELRYGLVVPDNIRYGDDPINYFLEYQMINLPKNGVYYFYVYDKYHNFGVRKVAIDYIDKDGPSFMVFDKSDAEKNTFNFEIELNDNFNTEDCRVTLGFDDVYSSILGVEPGTGFEVPTTDWVADDISKSGIYKIEVRTTEGGTKIISVSGTFKYAGSGEVLFPVITLTAEDGSGNRGGIWYGEGLQAVLDVKEYNFYFNPRNEQAVFVSGELTESGFEAVFNKPVMLITPAEVSGNAAYSATKENLPYFINGVYPVKYTDLFGEVVESSINVQDLDELYNCTISISKTEPTNENVTVLINAAFNPDITLELPAGIAGGIISPVLNEKAEVVGASITMKQNGIITFGLKPTDGVRPTVIRSIKISNIDKISPVIELEWVYTSEVIDGNTEGDVICSLKSNEELEPTQNTGTTHTFTFYDQMPYTFHYTDLAGNSGSITAVPPVNIIEKTLVDSDTTRPDYEMSIYQNIGGSNIKVESYGREEYELLPVKSDAFPLFAGKLRLLFEIFDENQTSISIKNPPVAGVSVSGNNVFVSNNADLVVVITDAKGNFTEVDVTIDKADNTPPTGSVSYVRIDPLTIRGYLTMNDDRGEVTIKNTGGILLEQTEGEYLGKYYHDFLDNESYTFLFADTAGNIGSTTAAVTTLDVKAPDGNVVGWVPFYIDENGNVIKDRLSENLTNSNVSVYIQFNKPVSEITASIVDGTGSLDDISINRTEDSATLEFRANAKVKLSFTALNTLGSSIVLEVDIIDKTPPVIDAVKTASDAKSVTYTFTSDEEVFFEGGGEVSEAGIKRSGFSFTKVLELNGIYDFKFTDKAGNATVKRIEVISEIDRVAPGITVEGLPATKESVEAYNLANGTSIEHKLTNQSIFIKASMNEAGKIIFRGVSYSVEENREVSLSIDYNGIYEITAVDLAGLSTRYRFTIDCIDKSKPQILFKRSTLPIRQGTEIGDFETKMLDPENLTVTDNADKNPIVTLSEGLTDIQLNTPGTYPVTFTVVDKAGNSQSKTSFVRVYDKYEPEVSINGNLAQPEQTMFVGDNGTWTIDVTVDNLPYGAGGQEPYNMYWKPGLNTPGLMKNAAPFTGSFTVPGNGFYTLTVVTQSRVSFITYIYVQR